MHHVPCTICHFMSHTATVTTDPGLVNNLILHHPQLFVGYIKVTLVYAMALIQYSLAKERPMGIASDIRLKQGVGRHLSRLEAIVLWNHSDHSFKKIPQLSITLMKGT